jgi:hypothetical protein
MAGDSLMSDELLQIRVRILSFESVEYSVWQCCGSGSVCFWSSRIRICRYLSDASINKQKVRKTLISTIFFLLLFDFLSLKTNVNIPSKSISIKTLKKILFFGILSATDEKKQDPEPARI